MYFNMEKQTMNFNEYQNWTRETAIYPHKTAFAYLMAGLGSEVGEVLGKYKKEIRDGADHSEAIISELGDVLWYVARIADEYGYELEGIAAANKDKLTDRKERDVLGGSGDAR